MAIEKNIKITVDTKGAVKSFDKLGDTIQEQKDITIEFEKELHRLEQQLLSTSKGNLAQQKRTKDRIVDLKGALKDQRLSLKSLNNERRKAVKVTDINTKSLSENYGVVQLLDQVTGGLASQVRSVVDANRLFNFSLKGTRTALIATGIGAFVIALGLIVAYWDDISDAIQGVTDKLEKQVRLQNRAIEKLEGERGLLDQLIELEGDRGDNAGDLLKQREDLLLVMQKEVEAAILLAQAELESVKASTSKLTILERIAKGLRGFGFGAEGVGLISEEEEALIKAAEDELLRLQKLALQLQIDFKKITEAPDPTLDPNRAPEESVGNGLTPEDAITLDSKTLLAELTLELEEESLFQSTRLAEEGRDLDRRIAAEKIEDQKKIKQLTIGLVASTIGIVGELAEEGSLLAKGVAIAQATMNTFQGITAALAQTTDPTPGQFLRFANAAAVGIFGLITVAKIAATKPIETGAPSGGAAGGRAPAPPSFNLVQGTSSNQIANSLQGQEPVAAIVVSRDVTSAQEADRNSENNSTL
tara:strand:+ start:888 stop:2480 length:1593 start_codon:yes stop_codon:yes gene_type:complete